MAREQPLSVGIEAELFCRAVGARPPAVITWWLDGQQLSAQDPQKESMDGNETISTLRWTPRMEHEGRVLTCRAKHIKLEDSTLEATMSLNLHYVPIVMLQLGKKLNPNDIEEGDDVYFECVVRANPPAYKVVWEHNGQVMTHKQRAGVITGSAHLVLQGVSRHQGGMYACTASNVEGDGRSPPLHLQVICKSFVLTNDRAGSSGTCTLTYGLCPRPPPKAVKRLTASKRDRALYCDWRDDFASPNADACVC
ncbi:B-cell receptor CD22 [Eumeta japonica]|uniref:B-cell receptor CD22 n=1 Tax=Eumeta variegata TaxID=151549 RepID=A0A4C1WUH8_EUMVA|nr:B-cell receptor CD22 [Eumeta japonica]